MQAILNRVICWANKPNTLIASENHTVMIANRGGVEDTKKIQGQGQECSRTQAQVFSEKKSPQKNFQAISEKGKQKSSS